MKIQTICFLVLFYIFSQTILSQQTQIKYLSGLDADTPVLWDFFCTKNRNSNVWTKIPVPSNWEQHGFGGYNYGHEKNKFDEVGIYRYKFAVPKEWKNNVVFIVFDGSMTDTEVKINGKIAGTIHQGGFYQFKYQITALLKFGAENLLEVTVNKVSANQSVNNAERNGDYWVFGGIYRPVYLETVPKSYIERVAIDAKADGNLIMDVYVPTQKQNLKIEAQVQTLDGKNIGKPFNAELKSNIEKLTLSGKIENPLQWSAEFPHIYIVNVKLIKGSETIHSFSQKFGFRTIEVRLHDGIYLNGKRIVLKGVNRHCHWPETGRSLSKKQSISDILLIKEMNMNAVRMSHYPPDVHFLDACDSLGLYVLDEIAGWQAKYDKEIGSKIVRETVIRDVNHPSILFWDNGNEGGWNREIDNEYKKYDPQSRVVLHPWERFNGLETKHYPDYNYVVNSVLYDKDIFMPTEFMHGLYDGGHGAGLDDFWNLMLKHPFLGGGFLWVFADEGTVRTDKNGQIDTYKNNAPDGIVGPHREKEASFYTIKEIWSPVYIEPRFLPSQFSGRIEVENRYDFTNLSECSFEWKLVSFNAPTDKNVDFKVNYSEKIDDFNCEPKTKAILDLKLPKLEKQSDALIITAFDPNKHEIFTWSWMIKSPKSISERNNKNMEKVQVKINEVTDTIIVTTEEIQYFFNKNTGFLAKVSNKLKTISLSDGPSLAGVNVKLKKFDSYYSGDSLIVKADYEGDAVFQAKWIFLLNQKARLEYEYLYPNNKEFDFMGITFNYPEKYITSMKWLGQGPFRVWKNRLKGQQFGVWKKEYNNTITGESWLYPEFKGYHSEFYWAVIENTQLPFTIYSENEGIFMQMLKPVDPLGAFNNNTAPLFPDGNIGFMNAISPIGTKFQEALKMGPQSQKNKVLNYTPYKACLVFDFR